MMPDCPHCGGESYEKMNIGSLRVYECEKCSERFKAPWFIVRIRSDGDERIMNEYASRGAAEAELALYEKSPPPGFRYEIREESQ